MRVYSGCRDWRAVLGLWVLISFAVSGCTALAPTPSDTGRPKALVWPPPPERPRITYVRDIRFPRDIRSTSGFWRKVREFLAGKEQPEIVRPYGLTIDGQENLYIADPGGRRVHIFHLPDGRYDRLPYRKDRIVFLSPIDVAVDEDGNIYVTDSAARKVYIFDEKRRLKNVLEHFLRPTGLAVDPALSRLYVVDTLRHSIQVFTTDGKPLFKVGRRGTRLGEFNFPTNICLDRNGNFYVTDSMNFRIQVFDRDGTFRHAFGTAGDGPGGFSKPRGVGVDSDSHIYVADATFDNVQIFNALGEPLLYFGNPGVRDGEFYLPAGLVIDGHDRIYVADSYNHRVQVFEYLHPAAAPPRATASIPVSLLLLAMEGDSAFIIESSTGTLYHYRKEAEGLRLMERYPFTTAARTAPAPENLPDGIFICTRKRHAFKPESIEITLAPVYDAVGGGGGISLREGEAVPRGSRIDGLPSLQFDNALRLIEKEIRPSMTPFLVVPKLSFGPQHEIEEEARKVLHEIAEWKSCWENRDLGCYSRFYSERFRHGAMDRTDWLDAKKSIFSRNKESRITIQPIFVVKYKEMIYATLLHNQRSDNFWDRGVKQLLLQREGNDWRIIQEERYGNEMGR